MKLIFCGLLAGSLSLGLGAVEALPNTEKSQVGFYLQGGARAVYNLAPPADSGLKLESGGFFHPVTTPAGRVLTDLAPSDHIHHRGVFLAWVEMHGSKDADFWGWGEHAPVQNRRIVNQDLTVTEKNSQKMSFTALNHWKAEDVVLVEEKLNASISLKREGNVLDLTYHLSAREDVELSRWAFSGFCLRVRKEGEIEIFSPQGKVGLPNPIHTKPESDWPDQPWYACTLKMPGGELMGGAVLNHPKNPPTLWHNHRDVRMINPCIVAPAAIKIKNGEPLVLRYRVVAFDGPLNASFLNQLASDWN